jgi:hypothetical protein
MEAIGSNERIDPASEQPNRERAVVAPVELAKAAGAVEEARKVSQPQVMLDRKCCA